MKTKNLNKRSDLRKVEGISSQYNKDFLKHLAFLKSRHLCLQQVARQHLKRDNHFFNQENEDKAVNKMVFTIENKQ